MNIKHALIDNHKQYRKTDDAEYGLTAPRKSAKWSGTMPIPARGERVFVNMNEFGAGAVRGYFVEHGWLGIYVEPDVMPQWWLKQNAAYGRGPVRCCMVFGAEIKSITEATTTNAETHAS